VRSSTGEGVAMLSPTLSLESCSGVRRWQLMGDSALGDGPHLHIASKSEAGDLVRAHEPHRVGDFLVAGGSDDALPSRLPRRKLGRNFSFRVEGLEDALTCGTRLGPAVLNFCDERLRDAGSEATWPA